MDNEANATQIVQDLWIHFNKREWDLARKLLDDNFEASWPQSNEVIKGPDNFIELNRKYPGEHKIVPQNFHYRYDRWDGIDHVSSEVLIETTTEEGKKQRLFAISFFEIAEQKIVTAREYWADFYPAPEWRKHLVQEYANEEVWKNALK